MDVVDEERVAANRLAAETGWAEQDEPAGTHQELEIRHCATSGPFIPRCGLFRTCGRCTGPAAEGLRGACRGNEGGLHRATENDKGSNLQDARKELNDGGQSCSRT